MTVAVATSTARLRYGHILAAITSVPWAILPVKMEAIAEFIAIKAAGGNISSSDVAAVVGAARGGGAVAAGGGVMVIPVVGTITPRADLMSEWSGGTTTRGVALALRQALADPEVGSIVLDIDSPGGNVYGVEEVAAEIYSARNSKPIVAVANSLMASAAYWIGAAASEVWVAPSGEAGSIGVLAAHEDVSAALEAQGVRVNLISAGKYKVEGNPYEPLGDEARGAIQKRVDEYYAAFTTAVARYRGATPEAVRDGFGEGRVVGAREAVKVGLADRVGTLDQAVARSAELARKAQRERGQRAERRSALTALGIE